MSSLVQSLILIGILAAAILLIFLKLRADERRREARFLREIRSSYGKDASREYAPGELEKLSGYYRKRNSLGGGAGFCLDDITWNDLDMDEVYASVNRCYSSIGEEYLYDLLRRPKLSGEELAERNWLADYFGRQEKEREALCLSLRHMGRIRGFSVIEYMELLYSLGRRSNALHVALAVLGAASVAWLCIDAPTGILAFLAMLGVNVGTYYRQMGKDRPYIHCLLYLVGLLEEARRLREKRLCGLEKYMEQLEEAGEAFASFRRHIFLLKTGPNLVGSLAESILDYFRMFFHLDIIKFNSMLDTYQRNRGQMEKAVETIGLLDAMQSVASWRQSLPYYARPQLGGAGFWARELYHPLLEEPVANDIGTGGGVLITGSNASGKSTFLKSAALCAVLGQTVCTATAREYEGDYFEIYTSMALRDDLASGESYYIKEIKAMKRILDRIAGGAHVLCMVDEVLRGTNTVERIAASTEVLKTLRAPGAICFAATHDIELTYLLEKIYENYHFTEEVREDAIHFSYRLLEGRSTSRNAIRLLALIGYGQDIVENARRRAQHFLESGSWELG